MQNPLQHLVGQQLGMQPTVQWTGSVQDRRLLGIRRRQQTSLPFNHESPPSLVYVCLQILAHPGPDSSREQEPRASRENAQMYPL